MNDRSPTIDPSDSGDLGYHFALRKNGEVALMRYGKLVTTLRGSKAHAFAAEIEGASAIDAQQLMARLTGNYKRGNERKAKRALRDPS